MTRLLLLVLLLARSGLSVLQAAPPDAPCEWSRGANGLAARICLSSSQVMGGSPLVVAKLSLRNSSNREISVAWSVDSMSYSIVDGRGAPVTTGINVGIVRYGGNISRPYDVDSGPPPLIVPPRGEISLDVPKGGGVPRNKAAVLQLGTFESIFAFEPTDRPIYLRAVLKIQRKKGPKIRREWSGRIRFPDVRIPLGQ